MPTAVTPVIVSDNPQIYEDAHVHAIYEEIAPHFSSTRYKPWPVIAQFLSSLPTGWIGLDSGTGNGKYLPLPLERPGSVWTIGLDRSRNLLGIARNAGGGEASREVVWGDVLGLPWRRGAFDYAISIATIHHLSTHARRKVAVQRIIESISPVHGRALIYVWAIEQDELSKRSIPSEQSDELNGQSKGQDVFVPWVLSQMSSKPKPSAKSSRTRSNGSGSTYQEEEAVSPSPEDNTTGTSEKPAVFNRYYHMFAQANELGLVIGSPHELRVESPDSKHIRNMTGIDIVQDGWERSNYYVEIRCWRK
ncbi:uncharacterized protein FIBRA_04494 [Fibroporia radiculosa]|uniref:Methyltransferase domain-containing protein n=1 Tax=Fibroporia radiculosa TaxID=599839 RepID=J4IA70_9APHY|nr:uncharacterized protein FIBRA_04494 [Fibroporia radiculosa]CCM02396.1 predicted protein [Fibroporia radiculosa]